jgi:dienelactone hydrolase
VRDKAPWIIVAAGAAVMWLAMSSPRAADVIGPEIVTFPNGTLTLHGVLWRPAAPGKYPVIVFNHGSEASPRDLPELGPFFASRGYVIFEPTRRGHGRSADQGAYISDVLKAERTAHGDDAWDRLLVKIQETDHLSDQLAGTAYVKRLPFVDPSRMAVSGGSFGGIQTVLMAERGAGFRAAIDFAGAAQTWADAPRLRARMIEAVRHAAMPIYFIQAENDYNLDPSRVLAAEMEKVGKPHRLKIYPPWGETTHDGHVFGARGSSVWAPDVMAFLEQYLK